MGYGDEYNQCQNYIFGEIKQIAMLFFLVYIIAFVNIISTLINKRTAKNWVSLKIGHSID